jgi:hypothetical protein
MIELSDIQRQLVLAVLAQAALAFVVLLMLPVPRILALRAGKVTRDAAGHPIFPKWATQVADCFNNQFQVPVLFYVMIFLTLWLHAESGQTVWLAWAFVGLRVAHAAVFVTSNFVPVRFALFLISSVLVMQMGLQALGVVL